MTYTDAQGTVHEPSSSDYRPARPIAGSPAVYGWSSRR